MAGLSTSLPAQTIAPASSQPPEIVAGKQALSTKHFAEAKKMFAGYLKAHPNNVEGELGLADAELGLGEYETAELRYREVVATVPTLWAAHKNLVIVEAALGRWDEFDRERDILRRAKQSHAAGISPRDSDVIDVLHLAASKSHPAERWIVRDYFEPEGRTQAVYNFEQFSADGKIHAFVSLESAKAVASLKVGDEAVAVGPASQAPVDGDFALDWYDGKSHGTIAKYAQQPTYEAVRSDFLRWAKKRQS
jgi:tetratricopeptide (TPR) repeat protein